MTGPASAETAGWRTASGSGSQPESCAGELEEQQKWCPRQVAKTDKQRLQDENKVLTDRNKKLLEELSDNIEDTTEQEILANRNANAIKDGPKLSYDEMNKRMKEA